MMTPAHVLRLASMPEPEKVEPTGVALAGRGRPRWGYQQSEWKLVFRSINSFGIASNLFVYSSGTCWDHQGCLALS